MPSRLNTNYTQAHLFILHATTNASHDPFCKYNPTSNCLTVLPKLTIEITSLFTALGPKNINTNINPCKTQLCTDSTYYYNLLIYHMIEVADYTTFWLASRRSQNNFKLESYVFSQHLSSCF